MSEKAALSKLCNDVQMVVKCLGARGPQKDLSGSGTCRENGKRLKSILGRRTHATSLHHDQIQKCLIALHSIQTVQGFFFFSLVAPHSIWKPQFPDQRSNPSPLHWKLGVLTTREVPHATSLEVTLARNINAGLLLFPPSILYPVLFHFKSMQNSLVVT